MDSAGVPGWGVDIPPQDSSNLQSSSPVGSKWFPSLLPDWVRPVITTVFTDNHVLSFVLAALRIASIVFYTDLKCLFRLWLELWKFHWLLPKETGRLGFYPPVCNRDLWTARWYASHIKPRQHHAVFLIPYPTSHMQLRIMSTMISLKPLMVPQEK